MEKALHCLLCIYKLSLRKEVHIKQNSEIKTLYYREGK